MGAVEADTVGETKPGHGKVVVGHAPPVPLTVATLTDKMLNFK